MKTLLLEKLFALAVAGVIVFSVFSHITAPLASALYTTQAATAEVESMARVFVTGKRMTANEKVAYDASTLANVSVGLHKTAAR